MSTDVTRSTMPISTSKTFRGQAEELLARFPKVDRTVILRNITALYLMDFKFGNKREERAACDFLNLLQSEAIKVEKSQPDVDKSKLLAALDRLEHCWDRLQKDDPNDGEQRPRFIPVGETVEAYKAWKALKTP